MVTAVNKTTVQNIQPQNSDVYKGQRVSRIALTSCEFAKRIALFAAVLFFSLGFALFSSKVQKLWDEIKEGKKITVISESKKTVTENEPYGHINSKKRPDALQQFPAQSVKTSEPNSIKTLDSVKPHFEKINSNKLIDLNGIRSREDFTKAVQDGKLPLEPVVIGHSEFVPKAMVEHLMRRKADSKLGVKMQPGDKITNMEGALHTFVTPITPITMSGDAGYNRGHVIMDLNGKGRNVVLSAAIHPDFEKGGNDEIVMKIVEIKDKAVQGTQLPSYFPPLWKQVNEDPGAFQVLLPLYEQQLQKHMVYHLTSDHRLPSLQDLSSDQIKTPREATDYVQDLIALEDVYLKNTDLDLKDKFVNLKGHVISLEALLHLYEQQIRNEFTILEKLLPQGYVYLINPPAIFAGQIGTENVRLLNRLQLLALKKFHKNTPLENLKMIGFSDAGNNGDREGVACYKICFPGKEIDSKDDLFKDNGNYSVNKDYALVVHNNSDAFGQNIETEGPFSLDGLIGSYSSAAANLNRGRPDLVDHIL